MPISDELIESIENNTIREITIDKSFLANNRATFIRLRDALLENTSIHVIQLSHINFKDKIIHVLSPALIRDGAHHTLIVDRCKGLVSYDRIFVNSAEPSFIVCETGCTHDHHGYRDPFAPYIGPPMLSKSLRSLSLINHRFNEGHDCWHLSDWVRDNATLQHFDLSGSYNYEPNGPRYAIGFIQKEICRIFKALESNNTLVSLNLSRINLTKGSVFDFLDSMRDALAVNTALKDLNLSHCELTVRGLNLLCKKSKGSNNFIDLAWMFVENNTLESIDLSYNNFKPDELILVLHALRYNTGLKTIKLAGMASLNNHRVMKKIAELIANNKILRHLDIGDANFDEQMFQPVKESLIKTSTLESLSLTGTSVTEETQSAVNKILRVNSKLRQQAKHRRVFSNIQLLLYAANESRLKEECDYSEVVVAANGAVEMHEVKPEFTSLLPVDIWLVIIEHVLQMEFPHAPEALSKKIIADSLSFQKTIMKDLKTDQLFIDLSLSRGRKFEFFKMPEAPFEKQSDCLKLIKTLDALPVYELSCYTSLALKVKSILQDMRKDAIGKVMSIFLVYKRHKGKFPALKEFPDLKKHLEQFDEADFLKATPKKTYQQALQMLC